MVVCHVSVPIIGELSTTEVAREIIEALLAADKHDITVLSRSVGVRVFLDLEFQCC